MTTKVVKTPGKVVIRICHAPCEEKVVKTRHLVVKMTTKVVKTPGKVVIRISPCSSRRESCKNEAFSCKNDH